MGTFILVGTLAAAATLQVCGTSDPVPAPIATTTLTTTSFCPQDHIPWPLKNGSINCQGLVDAHKEAEAFLHRNMPPWDALNLESIEEGILPTTLNLSFVVKEIYPWAAAVPRDVWQNYVLPYANVNEPRVDWRPLLFSELGPLVYNASFTAESIEQVVTILNGHLWSALRPEGAIHFKGGQTPRIYDPMSVLTYGFASCTGVSILLVDALRVVGVPARIAGTPAWNGKVSNGNHNWVEIWLGPGKGLGGDAWTFVESRPAGQGETLSNPCDKWFCNPAHFDGRTQAYAPQYDRHTNRTIYPMAWDLPNQNVPGVNRTDYYNGLCKLCGADASDFMFA